MNVATASNAKLDKFINDYFRAKGDYCKCSTNEYDRSIHGYCRDNTGFEKLHKIGTCWSCNKYSYIKKDFSVDASGLKSMIEELMKAKTGQGWHILLCEGLISLQSEKGNVIARKTLLRAVSEALVIAKSKRAK